jgi:sulfide:quinone oxidoreductase
MAHGPPSLPAQSVPTTDDLTDRDTSLMGMSPSVASVIVAGGGPAAVEALLALRDLAGTRVQLALVAPDRDLVIRAYEVLSPFHEGHEHRYPLAPIAAELDVELVHDALAGVDSAARSVALRSGVRRRYDALIVAVGARHKGTLPGAIPLRGAQDASRLKELLVASRAGRHQSVAFVVPGGVTWPLPLYELALLTSAWLADRGVSGVPLTIVSPEREPLGVFGSAASAEVGAVLSSHGVEFVSGYAFRVDSGRLLLAGGRELHADLAFALPRLAGPQIPGLPHDPEGYVRVDELGRVADAERVFAAGDATNLPIKQGGLATQQSDAIAALLAVELGSPKQLDDPQRVLRAVLFGGRDRRYLYAELGERLQETSRASVSPLWPESTKLLGRYLAPYLERLDS